MAAPRAMVSWIDVFIFCSKLPRVRVAPDRLKAAQPRAGKGRFGGCVGSTRGMIGKPCQPLERLGPAMHPQLGEDSFQVMFDRLRGQTQALGDGFGGGVRGERG